MVPSETGREIVRMDKAATGRGGAQPRRKAVRTALPFFVVTRSPPVTDA